MEIIVIIAILATIAFYTNSKLKIKEEPKVPDDAGTVETFKATDERGDPITGQEDPLPAEGK
jgi:hypothetical protein